MPHLSLRSPDLNDWSQDSSQRCVLRERCRQASHGSGSAVAGVCAARASVPIGGSTLRFHPTVNVGKAAHPLRSSLALWLKSAGWRVGINPAGPPGGVLGHWPLHQSGFSSQGREPRLLRGGHLQHANRCPEICGQAQSLALGSMGGDISNPC